METTDAEKSAGPRVPRLGTRGWAWLAAGVALAGVAFRSMLSFQPNRSLPEELEEWFFVPSETISPLVVALAGWLLFRRAGRLAALPPVAGSLPIGVALLAVAIAIHAWATWTGAADLMPLALMLSLSAALWLWRGAAAVRTAAVPIAFLAFAMAMPAPALNDLIFRLQLGTTELASLFLFLLGIPHFVAGEQIQRTHQIFSVIESCSGIRSIEILTMVAVLMADLFRRGPLHGCLLVLAAPGVAFGLNGLRALTLILNPHSEIAAIHNLQGVAILLAGLLLLFLWDGALEKLPARRSKVPNRVSGAQRPSRAAVPLLVGALAAMAAMVLALPRWEPPPDGPSGMGEFVAGLGFSKVMEVDRQFLGSAGFRETLQRTVLFGRRDAVLFVGLGARVRRFKSPLSPKTGLPGSGWVTEQESVIQLENGGSNVRVRVMRSGSRRWLVHHWYEGNVSFVGETMRTWLALDRSPWRRQQEIVAIRVGIPLSGAVETSRPEAEAEFLSFYSVLRPLLTGLRERTTGKNFSKFSRSRKTFSARSAVLRAT